jgi:hypothetical protein
MNAARIAALALALAAGLLTACGGNDRPAPRAAHAPAPAAAAADAAPSADDLLDWAAWAYPELLAYPGLTQTVPLDTGAVQARRHIGPHGDRWLGVDAQGQVWSLGDFTGGALRALGPASGWTERIRADRCQVYPLANGCGAEPAERRLGIGVAEGLATLGAERRLVAWGRGRGTAAVDLGRQARWLARADDTSFALSVAVAVGTDGRLSGWDCLLQYVPDSGDFYCLSSNLVAWLSAGRAVQAEGLHGYAVVTLREDGSLWLHEQPFNSPFYVERLHGLPPLRQLARSAGRTQLHDVLAVGLDGRVWQIDILGGAYAREFKGLPPMRSASCGGGNCLVLATDGTVWVWGFNDQGQLGNGNVRDEVQITPQPVAGLQDMVDVAVQHQALYAVGRDGRVWTWGGSDSPTPLPAHRREPQPRPVMVEGISGAVEIATSRTVVLVRRSDGSVWGWGSNADGLLDPRPGSPASFATPMPVAVPGLDLR